MTASDQFDNKPKVKKHRLNILPQNPEITSENGAVGPGRFPSWLHRNIPKGGILLNTGRILEENRLHTVCEEARCPNLLECWSKNTATFLAMGKSCTRSCGFCSIDFSKTPPPLEEDEPERIAESAYKLGLKHVVITMVARDDLEDGGAQHLVKIMDAVRKKIENATVELLTSDFLGKEDALEKILEASPEIFNHNVETVRELTPKVRHTATYDRSLSLLKRAKERRHKQSMFVKSGLMVGLGETEEQVKQTIFDLHASGCDIITIGQYLQPNHHKLRVKSFINPEIFSSYETYGYSLGVKHMSCGPFIRSSFNAGSVMKQIIGLQ